MSTLGPSCNKTQVHTCMTRWVYPFTASSWAILSSSIALTSASNLVVPTVTKTTRVSDILPCQEAFSGWNFGDLALFNCHGSEGTASPANSLVSLVALHKTYASISDLNNLFNLFPWAHKTWCCHNKYCVVTLVIVMSLHQQSCMLCAMIWSLGHDCKCATCILV